jgi:hypothetical protein
LTHPLVYIIILNWNGKEDTIACLRSIERVKYPNFSVILVDNASSDGTVEYVKDKFPSVKIIANSENLRFAGGNNVGIKYALERNADYVLLLNNDTEVAPDFLPELVRAAENDKSIGIAGPKIYYYEGNKMIWFAGGKVEFWKGWISHIGIREPDYGQYDFAREVDYITGCCMLVKREVIEKIGKLDESFFIYGEDADWSLRASRAGYSLVYVPSSIIWHKVSASSGGNLSWFKNWNKLKSQLRLMARYAKWYNWLTIPILMTIYTAKNVLRALKYDR